MRGNRMGVPEITLAFIALALFMIMIPEIALASGGPAHTETLMAGPYVIDVNLYQDPPMTDQSVQVTVVPHDSGLRLSGRILEVPGLGTDAVELHSQLLLAGQASFPITVAAPGAMPIWLGWLIGLTPLVGVAWLVWHQRRYRQKLLAQA